jgi:threonine synthase
MNHFVCTACGTTFPLDAPRWRCDCGAVLDIAFASLLDPRQIRERKPTMWRYREALPIHHDASIVSMEEGFTPLLRVHFGDRPLWIKQEQLFSSGSYKDRGASLLVSKIRELGVSQVVEDSSGNAGCAIAAYCARAGVECTILVPEDTSPAKAAQIEAYGARLQRVPGTREDTARAALRAAERTYYASHSWNPFFLHGTKTFAFEVCEQLGWSSPDALVLPVGNGTLLLGAYLGFRELLDAAIVHRMPRLIAVQAEHCAPLYRTFHGQGPLSSRPTMAEGIAIAAPIRGAQIVAAVRESGGTFLAVSEAEIERALHEMWRQGFYIEPTSAAAIAGASRFVRSAARDKVIVSAFTGHGLKSGLP